MMHKNISATMFYSLLFAMGGAPTIAMLVIQAQTQDPAIINAAFIGLSVIIACILVPIVLIQNAILFLKRKNEQLEQKIKPLCQIYLGLNILCLIYWLSFQFLK
jgi:DMSO reductase anchor subunit